MITQHKREPQEAAAREYLSARAASEGIDGLILRIDHSPLWSVSAVANGSCGLGETIAEAIADLRQQMSG